MTTLLDTALHVYDCPTCGTVRGYHCPQDRLCSSRLHLASLDLRVLEATVDSLMFSDPFPNMEANTEQEY